MSHTDPKLTFAAKREVMVAAGYDGEAPADRATVDAAKEAQELVGNVAAVTDQHDQKVIFQTANVPGTAGSGLATMSLDPVARACPLERDGFCYLTAPGWHPEPLEVRS
jgi:hypothetical protein